MGQQYLHRTFLFRITPFKVAMEVLRMEHKVAAVVAADIIAMGGLRIVVCF